MSNSKITSNNPDIIENIASKEKEMNCTILNTNNTNYAKSPFGEEWTQIASRIKENSPFRNFVTYTVILLMNK